MNISQHMLRKVYFSNFTKQYRHRYFLKVTKYFWRFFDSQEGQFSRKAHLKLIHSAKNALIYLHFQCKHHKIRR